MRDNDIWLKTHIMLKSTATQITWSCVSYGILRAHMLCVVSTVKDDHEMPVLFRSLIECKMMQLPISCSIQSVSPLWWRDDSVESQKSILTYLRLFRWNTGTCPLSVYGLPQNDSMAIGSRIIWVSVEDRLLYPCPATAGSQKARIWSDGPPLLPVRNCRYV